MFFCHLGGFGPVNGCFQILWVKLGPDSCWSLFAESRSRPDVLIAFFRFFRPEDLSVLAMRASILERGRVVFYLMLI